MYEFPKDPKKIRAEIRRFEAWMRDECKRHGYVSDGHGLRYLLGVLYPMLGDWEGALASFEWYTEMFPDDYGEPLHALCWALTLYRLGDLEEASLRLRQAMLSNFYMLPHLLHMAPPMLRFRHGSMLDGEDYVQYTDPAVWALWDEEALAWVRAKYESDAFRRVRRRFIEIKRQLETEPVGPTRSRLVNELYELKLGADVEDAPGS